MLKPIIRLVTCGSVDDGKSTLIGRLLVETDSVPHDTVGAARKVRRSGSLIPAGEIDFSLLTDGLEAEREQGITIDVAYRSMSLLNGRRLIIADAPGHEQYTRNMAVAASRADVALVLVDAARGVRTQTLRHLTICSLMGVRRIAIVVNKLDAVGYDQAVFDAIQAEIEITLARLKVDEYQFIPVSALAGDNVVFKTNTMPWYSGPSLLEYIQDWPVEAATENRPHLGVQLISRADNFRGIAGTVTGGEFKVGDQVTVLPVNRPAKIARISTFDGDLEVAPDGTAATLVLEPDVDATRGDVVELSAHATQSSDRFVANLVWLDETDLVHSRSYLLISGSTSVPSMVTVIRHKLNFEDGQTLPATALAMNEIGLVDIATDAPLPLNPYATSRETGNFILVDRQTLKTVAAGMVQEVLRRESNIYEHHYEITRDSRQQQKSQTAKVIWMTGLSGSGKSTIANALEKRLFQLGLHSYVLDGDNLRTGLNKDLGFTRQDRAENVRRVSEVSRLLLDAGLITIVALVSPFAADRDHAREMFEAGEFVEIWVKTDPEVCAQRDPKGLYKKAAAGEIGNLTGVGQEYEPPVKAELVLDGAAEIEANVAKILTLLGLDS